MIKNLMESNNAKKETQTVGNHVYHFYKMSFSNKLLNIFNGVLREASVRRIGRIAKNSHHQLDQRQQQQRTKQKINKQFSNSWVLSELKYVQS